MNKCLAALTIIFSISASNVLSYDEISPTEDFSLVLVLDNDIDSDCSDCGFIDDIIDFTYDISEGTINITTVNPSNCVQDGIFRDRFQRVLTVILNGENVGTLKDLTYDLSSGIIWVNTNELNFSCTQ